MPCLQATRSTRYTLTFSIIIIVGYVIKVGAVKASCWNEVNVYRVCILFVTHNLCRCH